jgi:hypothetical protein
VQTSCGFDSHPGHDRDFGRRAALHRHTTRQRHRRNPTILTKRITTSAPSPLGHWLALAAVSAVLLYFGLYLATDGGVNLKIQSYVNSLTSNKNVQQAQKEMTAAISDRFKKYERPQLLAYYGIAIAAGFLAAGWIGAVIRSYRFSFYPGQGVIERQAMWFFIPAWLLAWIVLALIVFLFTGTTRTLTIHVPVSFLIALLVPAAVWAWFADWAWDKVRLPLKWWPVRVYKWVIVWLSGALVILLLRIIVRQDYMLPLPTPLWLILILLMPPAIIVPGFIFLPEIARRKLFIPGLSRQIPASRIKRLEVQPRAEGGTILVLTFADERSWTICTSSPRKLQRLGGVLGRLLGLERRDLVTWS